MAGQFVKNGATLSCPLCSSSGTLVVSHTQVQLQDTPCATNGDRSKSNLVFGGVCKKWRKSPPPCASVIAPTQWNEVATDVEIDGEFMLLEDSTITCSTGGVDIAIDDTVQIDVPTDLPDTENAVLKKFLVNIRRSDDYKGEYGFDWLRDEYIYPINAPFPVCLDVEALKLEYRTKDIVNPITPYGEDYYPAWLSIFPSTTDEEFAQGSRMHKDGVNLDLEIEELEPLINDATEIIFESNNEYLTITPNRMDLAGLIGGKETKNLGSTIREYHVAAKAINIKCEGGALSNHEEIKIFAQLEGEKEEVGKLMVYKNDVIPKAEVVVVNVITGSPAALSGDYQYAFKYQSFNQALIRAEVKVDIRFDINSLPSNDFDVVQFKLNYINSSGNIGVHAGEAFLRDLQMLYEKYGSHSPRNNAAIDSNLNNRTYLFYTSIIAQTNYADGTYQRTEGIASADLSNFSNCSCVVWGNAYTMFGTALIDNYVVVHEAGHSLSLPHSFDEGFPKPHVFHIGFTDNYMDYIQQADGTANPFTGKMTSFFKWQWDIMRADRSLIFNY
ncbi:DUF4280 domain-containing protein [uncultured Aquimarina sp.]|uniref:DUF4280 domain-containing protein n=1 Tax=uncultured Aquimarina sp. TaxID=575652 RepID=UPI0026194B5F|nr:DUF4280 domain-containing protein [uncultured Aquimarina sp.]